MSTLEWARHREIMPQLTSLTNNSVYCYGIFFTIITHSWIHRFKWSMIDFRFLRLHRSASFHFDSFIRYIQIMGQKFHFWVLSKYWDHLKCTSLLFSTWMAPRVAQSLQSSFTVWTEITRWHFVEIIKYFFPQKCKSFCSF